MPPVVVAAGIGAAAGIGGGILSASAQKKAAKSAAGAAADNTAANNALARETYANNAARLDPYSANGMRAGNALSAMLLGTPQQGTVTSTMPGASTGPDPAQAQWAQGAVNAMLPRITRPGVRAQVQAMADDPVGALDYLLSVSPPGSDQLPLFQAYRNQNPEPSAGYPGFPYAAQDKTTHPVMDTIGTGNTTTPTQNALSPWDQFRNSTNYQWRLDQGNKGVNQAYAARGTLQSGAAQKGLLEYNQNFAANELGNYQQLLAQQQGVGLSAASALAGVSQNMVGQVTANNNSAASAAANAALMNGQANANMYGSIASGIGQVAGAAGSSYGTGAGQWHF